MCMNARPNYIKSWCFEHCEHIFPFCRCMCTDVWYMHTNYVLAHKICLCTRIHSRCIYMYMNIYMNITLHRFVYYIIFMYVCMYDDDDCFYYLKQ